MITEFLLNTISAFLKVVLFIVPDLPDMPSWVDTSLNYVVDMILEGVGFASYLFTPTILIFMLTTALVLMQFDHVYHGAMWVIRKLPIGIK